MSEFCTYIKQYYGVPADLHRVITHRGRRGIIVSDKGNYIGVNFDDEEPMLVRPMHPTSEVEYTDEFATPRKPKNYRSKQRYQHYISVADCYDSFKDYLKHKR